MNKKEKCLIYGCGNFYREHIEEVYKMYNVVGVLDKFDEKAQYRCLDECTENYSLVMIMISKVNIVFEAVHYLLNRGIHPTKIKLGIEKFEKWGSKHNIEFRITVDGGIDIIHKQFSKIVYNEDEFWKHMRDTVLPDLRKESGKLEEKLCGIHKEIFEMPFPGKGILSLNHDEDLFYRFPKQGSFGWGIIATLNLFMISHFDNPYILDLGCADGFYYRRFYSHIDNLVYVGCDMDFDSIQTLCSYNTKNSIRVECCDFTENMPKAENGRYFTNVFWYSSMQMFDTPTQRRILKMISERLGKEGILSGSVSIRDNDWKYCINSFGNEREVLSMLKEFFAHVWVYSDKNMGNDACFIASQREIPMMKYYC